MNSNSGGVIINMNFDHLPNFGKKNEKLETLIKVGK